jgi:formylglycine-generating enzyme required for sulfatase activity
MMAAADRFHAVRIATSAFVVLGIVILLFAAAAGASAWRRRSEVSALVAQLFVAEWSRVPNILRTLDANRILWSDEVERIFADRSRPPGERQRARLLLARHSESRARELTDDIASANPAQLTVIIGRLVPWKTRVLSLLWSRLRGAELAPEARVRIAAVAAAFDPSSPQWTTVAPTVSLALIDEADPLVLSAWVELLHPVENSIAEPLAAICLDTRIEMERRQAAAAILAEIGNNRPDLLERVLLECDSSRQFVVLSRKLATFSQSFAAHMRVVLSEGSAPSRANSDWQRRASAALALALLGDWSAVWQSLGDSANPSLRTRLIHRMRDYGVSASGLVAGLSPAQAPSVRQAILMALRNYRPESISFAERTAVLDYCRRMFVTDPDAGVHAGCELLLRAWGNSAELPALESRILVRTPVGNWYMTGQGHLMVAFAHPGRFTMGSPATEFRRDHDVERAHTRLIDRSFAIGAHEVSVAQFSRFRPNFDHVIGNLNDPDCPANKISMFDAFAYCRWLSAAEGMTEDQQCYPAEIGPSMKLPDNFLSRTGYRLPTEAEWEFGARAGSTTSRFFGDDATLLTGYAWFIVNSDDYLWPIGQLLPNRFGLYDVYGNVMEWCQGQFGPFPPVSEGHVVGDDEFRIDFTKWPVLRGGCYRSTLRENRSAKRVYEPAEERFSFVGMRLARTLPAHFLAADPSKANR